MNDSATLIRPRGAVPTAGSAPVSGTDTVCVGLKHPQGIVLQAYEMVDAGEVTRDGYKIVKTPVPLGEPFTLDGAARNVAAVLAGIDDERLIVGGFAITIGVPKELWDNWVEAHKDSALVRGNLIFAARNEQEARGMARERAELKSGLEPIDPKDPAAKTGMRFIEQGAHGSA